MLENQVRRRFLMAVGLMGGLVISLGLIGFATLSGGQDEVAGTTSSSSQSYDYASGVPPVNYQASATAVAVNVNVNYQDQSPSPMPSATVAPLATATILGSPPPPGFRAENDASQPRYESDGRIIIKNATLHLQVEDVGQTVDDITLFTESLGGWIVTSNVNLQGQNTQRGNIAVRVPADQLEYSLLTIKDMAHLVLSENVSGQDVTNQYTDLSSQLRNLQSAEDQLNLIMADAATTGEVLSIFNELTLVRGEIERIQGQLSFYVESSQYSSLTIDLEPIPPQFTPSPTHTPTPLPRWNPADTFDEALSSVEGTAQDGIDGLIWLALYAVLFGVAAIPFLAGMRVLWRWWRGRAKPDRA